MWLATLTIAPQRVKEEKKRNSWNLKFLIFKCTIAMADISMQERVMITRYKVWEHSTRERNLRMGARSALPRFKDGCQSNVRDTINVTYLPASSDRQEDFLHLINRRQHASYVISTEIPQTSLIRFSYQPLYQY